jgi:hypothetical protein
MTDKGVVIINQSRRLFIMFLTIFLWAGNFINSFAQNGNEIRDPFDIEFLLRKGIVLPHMDNKQISAIIKRIDSFTEQDFKVKLGSILTGEKRNYNIQNKFSLLKEKLST